MNEDNGSDDPSKGRILTKLSDKDRENLLEYHPVREGEFIIPTPAMKRAYSIIRDRVWARRTGAVFYASPRMGKTKCAEAAKSLLEEEFPKSFVSLLSARGSTRASDGHMSRLILEGENHVLSRRTSSDLLFDNAVADVEIKTKTRGGSQFVLIIDELQTLSPVDLQQLVCFHNALERRKVKMTTISFAQPEIMHRRTALSASQNRQIIARFLSELLPYNGCTESDDLRSILHSYDVGSEFPDGSGWSYTQFFAPIAFSYGFKLEIYTESIWAELQQAAGPGFGGMLPMEHICLTIQYLLFGIYKLDCANLKLSKDDIEMAVLSSQLASFNPSMSEEN